MKESSGSASSFSTVQRPVNGSDPVEEKRETMLGWKDLENMVDRVQNALPFSIICDGLRDVTRQERATPAGVRCQL